MKISISDHGGTWRVLVGIDFSTLFCFVRVHGPDKREGIKDVFPPISVRTHLVELFVHH